jgi:hypothetical protein
VVLVFQNRAHITGGELPSAARGMPVRVFGLEDLSVRFEGRVIKVKKFQGPECL